jgi:hypothetical protein
MNGKSRKILLERIGKLISTSVICIGQYKNWGGLNMKNKILALSLTLLLATMIVISFSPPAKAVGEGQWITAYTIQDSTTNETLVQYNAATGVNQTLSPTIPGAEIKITFTVNVFAGGSGNLQLKSGLQKSNTYTNGYWVLVSEDYDPGSDYNPNSNTALINWVVGEFTMTLYGRVPNTATDAAKVVNAVTLSAGGETLDQISIIATTANLAAFNTLYNQQQAKLKSLISGGVAQGYIEIFTNVLNASRTLANEGSVSDAIALLNGLNVANEPVSSTMESLFLPIVGVLAALAVILVILFLRIRGKVSYFQLVVEDQIKDLEGLTLRASKIDRTMSSNLESVKDRLKRLVGM